MTTPEIETALEVLAEIEDEYCEAAGRYIAGESDFTPEMETKMAKWAKEQIAKIRDVKEMLKDKL